MIAPIAFCHFPIVFLRAVSPAALSESEGKFRRYITSSDDLAELFHDLIRRFALNHIQIQIGILTGNSHCVHARITDIKRQSGRIVHKDSKRMFSWQNNKIMCAVQRSFLFRMFRIIRTVADIAVTSLVDSPVGLSKSIDHIPLCQRAGKGKSMLQTDRAVSRRPGCGLHRYHYCFCLKRGSIDILVNHDVILLLFKVLPKQASLLFYTWHAIFLYKSISAFSCQCLHYLL